MSHRNQTINPLATGRAISPSNPVGLGEQAILSEQAGLNEQGMAHPNAMPTIEPVSPPEPAESGATCESMSVIVSDVEAFTRGWIGRIRRLIHRSSQLIERESLLAGAIARLDQQKAEWSKRTASKEAGMRDQSKRLTEAWLEVEAQRRKAIQGARAAASTINKPGGGPIVAAPVATVNATPVNPANVSVGQTPIGQAPIGQTPVGQVPASQAPAGQNPTGQNPAGQSPVAPVANQQVALPNSSPQAQMPAAPPPVNVNVPVGTDGRPSHPITHVSNKPIAPPGVASTDHETGDDQAFREAEAATRQKIEEFKRMQRAIRSNRHK